MKNKRHTIRLATILSIIMLILIPFLSSPVAATNTFNVGTITTNDGGDPKVEYDSAYLAPGIYGVMDDESGQMMVYCYATMIDEYYGSTHLVELNMQKLIPDIDPLQSKTTNLVRVPTDTTIYRTLWLGDSYTVDEYTVWRVTVYAWCQCLTTMDTAYDTWTWYFSVGQPPPTLP